MNVQTAMRVLELRQLDDPKKVHHAFRRLVKRCHPDQFAHRPEIYSTAEERLKQVILAYNTLNKYFKELKTRSFDDNHNIKKHNTKQTKSAAPGHRTRQKWKHWLHAAVKKNQGPVRSPSGPNLHRVHNSVNKGDHPSKFDRSLRKVQSDKKTHAKAQALPERMLASVLHRRQRSRGTHIAGFGPLSPVSPIRRVSRIDPIEGSE